MKVNKAMSQEISKNVNFVPKEVQRILSSHKILENYNEEEVFYKKKLFLKFRNIHRKRPVLYSFLIKM